jgi:hypothetical protein
LLGVLIETAAPACQAEEKRVDTRKLASLEADPLAVLTFPGGELVSQLSQDEHTSLGKPIVAQLRRVFAFRSTTGARAAQAKALAAAREAGWRMNVTSHPLPSWLYGSKGLATGPATLIIHRFEQDGMQKMSVSLEHVRCPDALCGDA